MSLTGRVKKGFNQLSNIDEAIRQKALANLERWLSDPNLSSYRPQLEYLIGQERWDFLLDSFYRIIPFGTGGRRGRSESGRTGLIRSRYPVPSRDTSITCGRSVLARN
ncbi:MAG: hypothetical protein ACE5GM_09860 [bacterium]